MFAQEGDLPRTRTELLEQACTLRAKEENRTHRHTRHNSTSRKKFSKTQASFRSVSVGGLAGFAAWPLPENGSGRHDAFELSQLVGHLIDALGNHVTDESECLLRDLRDDRSLLAWREKLSHTAEQQRRNVREQRFQRPSFPDVLKFLEGGEPISLPDLHAIVCDHIRTLANEIENGPEDSYRGFWNLNGRGTLQSSIPENDARSRLRNFLNPKLTLLGISAEIEAHYARGKMKP